MKAVTFFDRHRLVSKKRYFVRGWQILYVDTNAGDRTLFCGDEITQQAAVPFGGEDDVSWAMGEMEWSLDVSAFLKRPVVPFAIGETLADVERAPSWNLHTTKSPFVNGDIFFERPPGGTTHWLIHAVKPFGAYKVVDAQGYADFFGEVPTRELLLEEEMTADISSFTELFRYDLGYAAAYGTGRGFPEAAASLTRDGWQLVMANILWIDNLGTLGHIGLSSIPRRDDEVLVAIEDDFLKTSRDFTSEASVLYSHEMGLSMPPERLERLNSGVYGSQIYEDVVRKHVVRGDGRRPRDTGRLGGAISYVTRPDLFKIEGVELPQWYSRAR